MSDTVSYTNVHLQYTSDVQGLRQAKADMAAMQRVTNSAKTETQKYEEHVQKLDRLLHNGKITQEQYNAALAAARTQYKQVEGILQGTFVAHQKVNKSVTEAKKAFQESTRAASNYASTLRGIAGATGSAQLGMLGGGVGLLTTGGPLAAVGLATAGAGYAAIESSRAYMNMRNELVRLEVLLGTAQEAEDKFREMRALAAISPLQTKDFTNAAGVLAQYGVESQNLMDTLKRLSDISAGNADVFSRLALAYGQVKAAGRLTGQEVRQLINAGFNPLAEISRTTGESMESLKDRMEAGDVAFREFASSVESATEAGGRFYGMTDRMGKEMSAQVAQVSEEWTKLKETIGETISPQSMLLLRNVKDMVGYANKAAILFNPDEMFRAFNTPGGDRQFAFRTYGRELGMKPGMMDPLTQREMEAAKREHETLVKQLEKKTASDSIKFFTVTAKAISDGVVGQMDGAMKSAAEINKQVQQAADAMREHSTDIVRNDIKRRAGALEDIKKLEKQLLELKPMQGDIRTDLPAAVEYGTREAYRVITDAQKMADDAHLKKLEEQRVLQQKQNDILMEIRDKQKVMGIVK